MIDSRSVSSQRVEDAQRSVIGRFTYSAIRRP